MSQTELEKVFTATSHALERAVGDLMLIKRELNDRTLYERHPRPPVGFTAWEASLSDRHFLDSPGPDYACWPSTTLAAVLPFFGEEPNTSGPSRPACVPIRSTLGSSFKWGENGLPSGSNSPEEALAFFTDPERAALSGGDVEVQLIRSLGLFYVSGNGKNRVAFLARHGIEWMPCRLTERDYPDPTRLLLVQAMEGPLRTWLCLLDKSQAVALAYPELTLPLLRAYGVEEGQWPLSTPMLATAMNAIRAQRADENDKAMCSTVGSVVDLSALARQESALAAPRQESFKPLLSHAQIEANPIYARTVWTAAAIALSVLLVGGQLLPGRLAMGLLIGSLAFLAGLVVSVASHVRVRPTAPSKAVLAALVADVLVPNSGEPLGTEFARLRGRARASVRNA